MDIEEVKKWVAEIERVQGDFERAHGMEDDLHVAVLRDISVNCKHKRYRDLAEAALETTKLEFAGYCA